MQAFHNDPKIKTKYLMRVRAHAKADEQTQQVASWFERNGWLVTNKHHFCASASPGAHVGAGDTAQDFAPRGPHSSSVMGRAGKTLATRKDGLLLEK